MALIRSVVKRINIEQIDIKNVQITEEENGLKKLKFAV